jgi:DNA repair protein RadC
MIITPKRARRASHTAITVPHIRIMRDGMTLPNLGQVRSPEDAANLIRPIMATEEVEVFVVLHLSSQANVIGWSEVGRGLVNATLVHPREVFRPAIAFGAAAVIVAHNHPSGNSTPSPEDRTVTRQLVQAGQMLDIPVYDHIIIAGERYFSFGEAGLL